VTPASLQFTNRRQLTNTGEDARYGAFSGAAWRTDQHRFIAIPRPVTGHTRLIFGTTRDV